MSAHGGVHGLHSAISFICSPTFLVTLSRSLRPSVCSLSFKVVRVMVSFIACWIFDASYIRDSTSEERSLMFSHFSTDCPSCSLRDLLTLIQLLSPFCSRLSDPLSFSLGA